MKRIANVQAQPSMIHAHLTQHVNAPLTGHREYASLVSATKGADMLNLNRVCLLGHVGRDAEARQTQTGGTVTNFSLATNEAWTTKDGERKTATEWHRIVVFSEREPGYILANVRKGSAVYVEGALKTRKWTNREGNEVDTTEVVVTPFRGIVIVIGGGSQEAGEARQKPATGSGTLSMGAPAPREKSARQKAPAWDLDDEIPF